MRHVVDGVHEHEADLLTRACLVEPADLPAIGERVVDLPAHSSSSSGVAWLNEAQNELLTGKWWQLAAATLAMAILVTTFSLFTDSLRDALDPRLK